MADTMTLYGSGDEPTVVPVQARADGAHPGKFLIASDDGKPFCCEFSLQDNAYTIVLPPASFIVIDAQSSGMFQDTKIDDHVIYILPGNNPADYYVEQYLASIREVSPHIVLALRYHDQNRIISAVLYPRDIETMPAPLFMTQEGKTVSIDTKGMNAAPDKDAKAEYAHHPEEVDFITNAIYNNGATTSNRVDPNLPREEWM